MPYDQDTAIGGPHGRFPQTRHSAVYSMRSEDAGERQRAYSAIVNAYWKPAYKYIRIQWRKSNEDAKDLTQAFFTRALEKNYFRKYDPANGTFRGFLRVCIDGFVANEAQAATRLKRGGGTTTVPLDFESAEGELRQLPIADNIGTEEMFYREWVRHLFATALETLRAECDSTGRQNHFAYLERYDIEQTAATYDELARETAAPVTTVTNQLAWARRRFRAIVLDLLRDATGSDEEFQREARQLLGTR
jgi:RNA polymerase sigma factor (sigma-70 family)